jgi:transposase-like protein
MPHLWSSLLTVLSKTTRENYTALVCCPHCVNQYSYVKHGFYRRYLFDDDLINIQRYRCDNDACSQKTFSILPHAFLRITRASLCMFMHVLKLYEQGNIIASIARNTGNNWPRIQRWIAKAIKIRDWVGKEYGEMAPCLTSKRKWTFFIRDFS